MFIRCIIIANQHLRYIFLHCNELIDLTIVFQDCAKKTCTRYECSLRNIPPGDFAIVALDFVINKDLLKKVVGAAYIVCV